MKRAIILSLAIMMVMGLAQARVPRTMNVQGVLTDDSGNTLPDGDYTVSFMLWDSEIDGSDLWNQDVVVHQLDGYFDAVLGLTEDFDPTVFTGTLWLSMQILGDSPMEPRIQMTSVATALRSASLERNAAVLSLNGMRNNVNLQAGANVTITPQDSTLVIAATAGAGGDDGDWIINGSDVSHYDGTVYVGPDAAAAKAGEVPPEREGGSRVPLNAKMKVQGNNEGIVTVLQDSDGDGDGKAALYAHRKRTTQNDGIGFGIDETNTAITGYNDWGDRYTFGVAGYTWFDFDNTGGVLGARQSGATWGALAFRDSNSIYWGMYTPNNAHVGGLTETQALRVKGGAVAGHILTSDSNGNASWQAPGAASSDGDWTISGNNLYSTRMGAVAIGTSSAHPLADTYGYTTMQVSSAFAPAICLDATYNGLRRWSIWQNGDKIRFSRSDSYASLGTAHVGIERGNLEVNRYDGSTSAVLQGEGADSAGSALYLYSTSTSTTAPTVVLDAQDSSSQMGGSLTLRDRYGNVEIMATANYSGTNQGRLITPVLEITGGSDLSEQFDIGNTSALTEPGMVVSIDPENPGQLTLSGKAYDRRVAGVISGAGGVNTGMVMGQRGTVADGELPVALVGRVYVWADASGGPIEPGDLLTTSDRPGHAMKVTDHGQATGAILGKAMTGLSEGQGLILTLVTLQ
jgi:hypothetical protein